MSGGNTVVELWGDQGIERAQDAAERGTVVDATQLQAPRPFADDLLVDDPEQGRRRRPHLWAEVSLAIVAVTWIGATLLLNVPSLGAYANHTTGGSAATDASRVLVALIPVILMMIVAVYVIQRSNEHEGVSLAKTLAMLSEERNALMRLISDSEHRLFEGARAIYTQGEQLDALGTATVNKIATLRAMLDEEISQIAVQTNGLKNAAAAARSDMAVLLANLPKAQIETRKICDALQGAGNAAQSHTEALTAQLAALAGQATQAEVIAVEAADLLARQVSEMANQSAVAQSQVKQSQAALQSADEAHVAALQTRVSAINEGIAAIGTGLDQHDGLSSKLLDRLRDGLADVEGRLAAIDTHGTERTERLTDAIKALTDHSHRLREELASGGDQTHRLIADAEALMVALDASARELDETLPAALERVARVTAVTHGRIAEATDQADAVSAKIRANIAELSEADNILVRHQSGLEAVNALVAQQTADAHRLVAVISDAQAQLEAVAGGASVQLVEALVRVRETAKIASERAQESISKVIPNAVTALGVASETAFRDALDNGVKEKLAQVSEVAAQAVLAANDATERLMQQMLTIAETSANFADQISAAEQAHETTAQTSLSRRVSLLIESLNSIAIDVTKILSNDVTDAAWASYLKGDRGVFTRRAVKLIDTSDMRDILRHYYDDAEFRSHVNHYIHDFEAMLRAVLNSRESGPLSVTLLSSDMGKLYVALAHAIERLRT
jgi:hypothetical protein